MPPAAVPDGHLPRRVAPSAAARAADELHVRRALNAGEDGTVNLLGELRLAQNVAAPAAP